MGQPRVSRAEWGANPPRSSPQGINTQSVTAHWEGPHMGSFDHSSCASKVKGIQSYHQGKMGWNDIAYNFLVCPHGYIFEGRGHGIRSSANGTNASNNVSEAVCYLSGQDDPFTAEAKTAMSEVMNETSQERHCHKDWYNTACPGDEICNWVKSGFPDTVPPSGKFGPFPLPTGHWYGPPNSDDRNHSGFYNASDKPGIVKIQQCLTNYCGHPLSADGMYGDQTTAAVHDFQSYFGLVVDGLTGLQTWNMMEFVWDSHN
jgi:Putative peptidoglycan binding domain